MSYGPPQDVTFGSALEISLNNYYDLLKNQVGGLRADEYLQLKLVADAIDISQKDYPYFSLMNLHSKADVQIKPNPVDGTLSTSAVTLDSVYGEFIRQLVTYVTTVELSVDDQKKYGALLATRENLSQEINGDGTAQNPGLIAIDIAGWQKYAAAMGYSQTDMTAHAQWDAAYGHGSQISDILGQISQAQFSINTIIQKQYPDPEDAEIVQASVDYDSPSMRMCYPLYPDSTYGPDGEKFNLGYLSGLPQVNSAFFDSLRVIAFDKSLSFIQTAVVGSMDAKFDKTTDDSTSITTDWGASVSASYAFISVNASVSDHTSIQNDFTSATSIELSADAVYKVGLLYPKWFRPELFQCKHVQDNIKDFQRFFGPSGLLLYYPINLICVRGFKTVFSSAQGWTYDYENKFSASAGGGISIFGISFGDKYSYDNDTKEHKVYKTATTLTIADDETTVRFVGYGVAKNDFHSRASHASFQKAMGDEVYKALVNAVDGEDA